MSGEPARAFSTIGSLRDVVRGGDERLPGRLVFAVSGQRRGGDEVQALRIANKLAKSKGRPTWVSSANSRWIVDRVITDLTDFMEQGPSPYLCGGVENYIATLRTYVDQVSTGGGRSLEEVREAQADRARKAIEPARIAMRPVPAPRYAPDFRPIAVIASPLETHPSFALRRGFDGLDLMLPVSSKMREALDKPVYGPQIDPGLPLKSELRIALDTDANRLAAIDGLLAAAVEGGFLNSGDLALVSTEPAGTETYRPVLRRLAGLRQVLTGQDARIADALARRSLVEALSEIEILDYLAHAGEENAEPLIAAIETTFTAILEARRQALAKASG
ncbi:hypothetical protein [Fulvimarina sp. MAC3]|uniref:hypothetical protein n=1 Tax=Fulvimarina sp. MAC3 TaxID=3148887 RepID=UPI0031FBE755